MWHARCRDSIPQSVKKSAICHRFICSVITLHFIPTRQTVTFKSDARLWRIWPSRYKSRHAAILPHAKPPQIYISPPYFTPNSIPINHTKRSKEFFKRHRFGKFCQHLQTLQKKVVQLNASAYWQHSAVHCTSPSLFPPSAWLLLSSFTALFPVCVCVYYPLSNQSDGQVRPMAAVAHLEK